MRSATLIDGFAAVNGLGNHELFVFGPGKSRGNARGRLRSFDGRVGVIDQKSANQSVQGLKRGKLLAALIGGQHGFERIGSCENDFGESRSMFLGDLGSENIFEFVSKLA